MLRNNIPDPRLKAARDETRNAMIARPENHDIVDV